MKNTVMSSPQTTLSNQASNRLIDEIIETGARHHLGFWDTLGMDNDHYLSSDCSNHAPLLHGYAVLLEDQYQLAVHEKKLISCFGSPHDARHAFYNFDNIIFLRAKMISIAHKIECDRNFRTEKNAFAMHRAAMKQHYATQREIAALRCELQRKRPGLFYVMYN